MILLMTTSPRAQNCADAISQATSTLVKIAATPVQASTLLSKDDFSALIIDEQLHETEGDKIEPILSQMGLATPVYVNLAISGPERVIRRLRSELRRREKEILFAQRAAEQKLRNELKDTITAMLLSCEMALQVPTLPPAAEMKLRSIDLLAREMRSKLEPAATHSDNRLDS